MCPTTKGASVTAAIPVQQAINGLKPYKHVDMNQLFELYMDFCFKIAHNLLDNDATQHGHFNSYHLLLT